MSARPSVTVVLPCLNEVGALPGVLASLPAGYVACVVDNGSSDGTAALARDLGATVVIESKRGFGSAVHAGLTAATTEYVAIMDADGSFTGQDLPRLLEVVRAGEADMVLGRRVPFSRSAWPAHARLANVVLARTLRSLTGYHLRDLGPMRIARRSALLSLNLQDRRSGCPLEMLLGAAAQHWHVAELPVAYAPRVGKSKVTGTLRGTLVAVHDMRGQLRAFKRAQKAEQ